jgi:hypothetical protein
MCTVALAVFAAGVGFRLFRTNAGGNTARATAQPIRVRTHHICFIGLTLIPHVR